MKKLVLLSFLLLKLVSIAMSQAFNYGVEVQYNNTTIKRGYTFGTPLYKIELPCGQQTFLIKAVNQTPTITYLRCSGLTNKPANWTTDGSLNCPIEVTTDATTGGDLWIKIPSIPTYFEIGVNFVRKDYSTLKPDSIITGPGFSCSNASYTLGSLPDASNVSWAVTPSFVVASSSGAGNTANLSPGLYGGQGTLTYALQTNCGNTTLSRKFWIGDPGLQQITHTRQEDGYVASSYTVNSVSVDKTYILKTNTELAQLNSAISWSPSPASINGYSSGQHQYTFNLAKGQAVTFTITATNSCGIVTKSVAYTTSSPYRVTPNPTSKNIAVEFEQVRYLEALPERIELMDEKTGRIIESIEVASVFSKEQFKTSKRIDFSSKSLPSGTYYIRVLNSRNAEKRVDMMRVVLN